MKGEPIEQATEPSVADQAAEVYAAYPLKVGKPAALRAIVAAIHKHGFDKVKSATEAFAAARAGDKAFIPHPSTWFNQERYNDDPSTWVRATPAQPNSRTAGTFNEGKASQYANGYS